MPTPQLDRRPEATAFSIETLVRDAREGRVRVPPFQRPLKWKLEDARDLLDSIHRGFPIGTLLFWKRKADAEVVRLGPLTVEAPARSDALWVVDGQQRLTVLATTLALPPEAAVPFSLVFNLDTGAFERWKKGADKPPHLPLHVVLDSERLAEWVFTERPSDAQRTAAFRLGKNLREYSTPAYTVEAEDEGAVREIFNRMNTWGHALEQSEVFDALHGAWGHEQPSTLRALSRQLLSLEFGVIGEKFLLMALMAIEGRDLTKGAEHKRPQPLAESLVTLEAALRATVVFLKRDAGIPNVELLPYKLPLVTLARFFNQHPEPLERERELLARWLWRGAITGAHVGDTAVTRKTLNAIDGDAVASVQRLLRATPHPPPSAGGLGKFNYRNAQSKLEVLALLSLGPRDLRTNLPVELADLLPPQKTSAESPARKIVTAASGPRAQSLANRMLHPLLKRSLQRELIEVGRAMPEALASHAISIPALERLIAGVPEEFLELRAADLARRVSRFLDAHARWGEGDYPSIEGLLGPQPNI